MLRKNPLDPPRPARTAPAARRLTVTERLTASFVSAEDFDGTGILAGVDPCESRYWWVPELGVEAAGPDSARPAGNGHAATGGRTAPAG